MLGKCDKEVGRIGNWHLCGKKAVVEVESKKSVGTYLQFCKAHADKELTLRASSKAIWLAGFGTKDLESISTQSLIR